MVGVVVAAHGLQGRMRVKSLSDFPERLTQPGQRWLRRPGSDPPTPMDLVSGQYFPAQDLYRIRLAPIKDRTTAESWIGAELLVSAQDRPTLAEDEYYLPDMIGMAVIHAQGGEEIGQLVGILAARDDVLEVQAPNGKRILIPFVKALVPEVDLPNRRLVVDPPPGLLEAYLGEAKQS